MSDRAEHKPVLVTTLAEQIQIPPDGVMVDGTIGQGGHSYLFGQILSKEGLIIGFDVDEKSIKEAEERLKGLKCRKILVCENFLRIKEKLEELRAGKADFILADLGISSGQLTDWQIGLSFQQDMPLDMRIDKRLERTAADIINYTDEKKLADLIYKFGEERASRRIARFIAESRKKQKVTTTGQLANIVSRALSRRGGAGFRRIHPATRTFQALRIAVNNELENLGKFLEASPDVLKQGGKIAVISYHSLEDRMVKENFRKNRKEGIYKLITEKPIVPDRQEIIENIRARSAKLRIAERQ